jgi:hypothetical protein
MNILDREHNSPQPENEQKEPSVVRVTTIEPGTIKRLKDKGMNAEWKPLSVIEKDRIALNHLPEDESGIVIGSGPNTKKWEEKGWTTLDIDPEADPDILMDAQNLTEAVEPGSQNYIFTECLTFDPKGNEGVVPARLLQQANIALKMGGQIIIETANFSQTSYGSTIPNKDQFIKLLVNHGFEPVVEVHALHNPRTVQEQQLVIYYGTKIAEGWDDTRVVSIPGPGFDAQTGDPIVQAA